MTPLVLFISLASSVCGQTAPAKYPEVFPPGVKLEANLAYAQYPETVLDVFWHSAQGNKRPAMIVIHGGGWVGGSKEAVYENFVRRYLEKGFVVANVEYRLAKAAPAPAAVEDVIRAANWFSERAAKWNVDRRRIAVTGGSAGGHLALMVGMVTKAAGLGKPPKVAAVINFYGITDVADQLSGPNMRQYAVTWIPDQPGRIELARRLSPLTYVRRDVPPVLTIHGDADETVPYEHGVQLTKMLVDSGARAEMISVPQGGHGFPKEKLDQLYSEVFAFLARNGVLR
ncbi:MAG: alpha/beta hydrolase [Bryobacteraceae bacterium]|nr:alpha/beta hydrolase [Bryobacteraceae bacterium]MDW8377275.1 alpha/beta hydrolase [Bryobacterales bacterium]